MATLRSTSQPRIRLSAPPLVPKPRSMPINPANPAVLSRLSHVYGPSSVVSLILGVDEAPELVALDVLGPDAPQVLPVVRVSDLAGVPSSPTRGADRRVTNRGAGVNPSPIQTDALPSARCRRSGMSAQQPPPVRVCAHVVAGQMRAAVRIRTRAATRRQAPPRTGECRPSATTRGDRASAPCSRRLGSRDLVIEGAGTQQPCLASWTAAQ